MTRRVISLREADPNSLEGLAGNDAAWQGSVTSNRFAGRTVIVTGTGSGIGLATTLRVAREGGRVIAADISSDRLDVLVSGNQGLDLVPVRP